MHDVCNRQIEDEPLIHTVHITHPTSQPARKCTHTDTHTIFDSVVGVHVLVRVCVAEMPVVRNRPKGLGWMGDRRVARHAYGETDGSSLNHRATRRETRRRQLPCLLLSGRPLKLARRAHHVKQLGHWWRAHIGGLVFFLFPLAKAKLVSTTLCCETFLQQPKFKDFSLFFSFSSQTIASS